MGVAFGKPESAPASANRNNSLDPDIPINLIFTADVFNRWTDIALETRRLELEKRKEQEAQSAQSRPDLAMATEINKVEVEVTGAGDGDASQTCRSNEIEIEIPHQHQQINESCSSEELHEPLKEQKNEIIQIDDYIIHSNSSDLLSQSQESQEDEQNFFAKHQQQQKESRLAKIEKLLQYKNFEEVLSIAKEMYQNLKPFSTESLKVVMMQGLRDSDADEEGDENNLEMDMVMKRLEILKEETLSKVYHEAETLVNRVESVDRRNYSLERNQCAPFYSHIANCYANNKGNVLVCQPMVKEFTKCVQQTCQK